MPCLYMQDILPFLKFSHFWISSSLVLIVWEKKNWIKTFYFMAFYTEILILRLSNVGNMLKKKIWSIVPTNSRQRSSSLVCLKVNSSMFSLRSERMVYCIKKQAPFTVIFLLCCYYNTYPTECTVSLQWDFLCRLPSLSPSLIWRRSHTFREIITKISLTR